MFLGALVRLISNMFFITKSLWCKFFLTGLTNTWFFNPNLGIVHVSVSMHNTNFTSKWSTLCTNLIHTLKKFDCLLKWISTRISYITISLFVFCFCFFFLDFWRRWMKHINEWIKWKVNVVPRNTMVYGNAIKQQ